MPGWEVRSFRRVAIVYRGERWFVAAKAHDGWRFHYTLERWDAARGDIDGGVVDYDAQFVAERDGRGRARAAASGVRTLLLPLYPLIGLLPAEVKRRLADAFGISEERSTALSIVLEASLALMIMGMLTISSFARIYGGALGVDSVPFLRNVPSAGIVALVLLIPDAVMRYAKILGESRYSWGFWEWLFRRER
jgi:hypothetical protein